jgi:hypothetical protein
MEDVHILIKKRPESSRVDYKICSNLCDLKYRKRAQVQALVLRKAELDFFHFLEIGWLVPSADHKILVHPGWYLPQQKIPLPENRFLQAGKGVENTKEKSRQCLLFGWRDPCKSAFYSSLILSLIQC